MPKQRSIPYLEEVRQTPHICLAEGLRSATRAVTKIYGRHLGDAALGVAQTSILMRLYYLGEPTMSQLAEELETDRTTMTRNIDILQRDGFVVVREGADRRSRVIEMTDSGFAALVEVLPRWQRAQAALRDALGAPAWQQMLDDTRTLAKLDQPTSERSNR